MKKIKYVTSSKILRLIILSVICYGICINLVDAIWKKYIEILYEHPEQIVYLRSKIELYRGLSGFVTTLIAVVILKRFSWKVSALISPVCFFILTIIFAMSIYLEHFNGYLASFFLASNLQIIVFIGGVHNIITLATKYEFYEPAKEIAYISIDEELRTKGKAIVEIIGSRLGKSSGSALQWILLSLFTGSNLLDLTPVLIIVSVISLVIWIISTIYVAKEIKISSRA